MEGVVTLTELDRWVGIFNLGKGESLPSNWKVLISEYINRKKKMADIYRKKLKEVEDVIEIAEGDYYLLTGVKFK